MTKGLLLSPLRISPRNSNEAPEKLQSCWQEPNQERGQRYSIRNKCFDRTEETEKTRRGSKQRRRTREKEKKKRDKPRVESDKWRKSARRWWCTRQPRSRSRTKWRKRRGATVFFSGGGLVTAATRRWCGGGGDRRQRLAVWAVQIRAPFEGRWWWWAGWASSNPIQRPASEVGVGAVTLSCCLSVGHSWGARRTRSFTWYYTVT